MVRWTPASPGPTGLPPCEISAAMSGRCGRWWDACGGPQRRLRMQGCPLQAPNLLHRKPAVAD
jgi:hypothetical protein